MAEIQGWGFECDDVGQVQAKADGETVAHAACARGHLQVLQMLLPVPIEGDESLLTDQRDHEGFTPLHYALSHDQFEAAVWAIQNGTNVGTSSTRGAVVTSNFGFKSQTLSHVSGT